MSRAVGTYILVWFALLAAGGCGGEQEARPLRVTIPNPMNWFRGATPEQQVDMLYDERDPDRIREGIALVSGHDWGLEEPYLERYADLARNDPDPSVRSAALRALAKARDDEYAATAVAALADEDAMVRLDASAALDVLVGPEAAGPLRRHARTDDSSDVRGSCARALRHYDTQAVRETLVRCLLDEAFAVRYQARKTLMGLTGHELGYDPEEWAKAVGGELPPAPQRDRPWWDWAGVTEEEPPGARDEEPARARPQSERPWWDWAGVTEDEPGPLPPTATQPASRPEPPRPWWDWMGVTQEDEDSEDEMTEEEEWREIENR